MSNDIENDTKRPDTHPLKSQGGDSDSKRQTLQDIENDIANANFDMSDVDVFGDHDSPEIDSIGDISDDAQSVLDKIQQQVEAHLGHTQDTAHADASIADVNTAPTPQKDIFGGTVSPFVETHADNFQQAVENRTSTNAEDDSHLDLDFDAIQAPPPKQNILFGSVLNVSIFAVVLFMAMGGVYYAYTYKTQIQSKAPVILSLDGPTKVEPIKQTGMKIENLDKDVYNILDNKKDISEQVERLRPLPQNPIQQNQQSIKPTHTENMSVPTNTPVAYKVETVKTEKGAIVEKIILSETHAESNSDTMVKPVKTVQKVNAKSQDKMGAGAPTVKKKPTPKSASKTKPAPKAKTTVKTPVKKSVSADSTQGLGWRVQLAALRSKKDAQKTKVQMQSKYPVLKGVDFYVEQAVVKGKTYYRLQVVKFSSKKTAIQVCAQIKKMGGSCIVKK